jgi:hypothetical protein
MESMSIFTFRKKMLTKKNRFFGFSTFFNIRYHTCGDILAKKVERVHKKNAKKRRILGHFPVRWSVMSGCYL